MLAELLALLNDHFSTAPAPDTPIRDTELTSLDMIELAVRIEEQFGVRVDERAYQQCDTVEDLATYIEEHAK